MTGDEINDTKRIAINYMKGKFWLDVISTIPFDLIFKVFDTVPVRQLDDSRKFILFSCLKLVRILRLSKIIDFVNQSDDFKLQLKLGKLLFMLILYIHLTGCAWMFVNLLTNEFDTYHDQRYWGCKEELPSGTWIPA
jgi:hypothetical protein